MATSAEGTTLPPKRISRADEVLQHRMYTNQVLMGSRNRALNCLPTHIGCQLKIRIGVMDREAAERKAIRGLLPQIAALLSTQDFRLHGRFSGIQNGQRGAPEQPITPYLLCRGYGELSTATTSEEQFESWQNPRLMRAIVGDTVLCNGILRRLGEFAEEFSIAANLIPPTVASLGKNSGLLAASVAPLQQKPCRPAECAALLHWQTM